MINKKPQNVVKLPGNRHTMLTTLRDLAKNSSKVFFSAHAEQQMHDRNITRTQVMECIRIGTVFEEWHQDIHGGWRCTLQHIHAGDDVHVVSALDSDCKFVVIITTF
ncbi:MAG: DUF4258 domain-containing protein [Gammaproteobacteria bacterium]|jgi:hypothetical protein|uniref:DUF4258 domain-containing protein n=1 Tax=Acidithiobacillus ferrooxidans TaxID=920 RepID=UPI002149393C|nr:DUF4258 domain-containing protein [Acidithiobacillus ferrooxidans]MCL4526575.1 DUF4258 domain-containing protein [Gammaproteobacteria bacterium]MCR1345188.1 DUF4258 domain-containing protein [Acidithiobacillus ferrooxidans]MCR1355600.1 DUF4258 domain-containing protein [Acidithiobacillus ferrooxidans]MDA8377379.1 DUF4258 domain-containing protein [Planctomycetia bacterium]